MEDGRTRISIKGLWKVYGANDGRVMAPESKQKTKAEIQQQTGCVLALRDLSFDVAEGETFVVMGLSGSGKSTLVRCLIRLIEPTAGEIWIEGEDVLQYSSKQLTQLRRNKTAMVFQHFGLMPHRSVIDNVAMGLEIRGVDKETRYTHALAALERVDLKGWEQSFPDELSGGMKQRVGLARALALGPDILLMDEPFSALDPLIRRSMQDQLIKLQRELRKTMVFITHDLDEALRVGDRIGLMKDGEIVQVGTPEEIVSLPADEYVGDFVRGISKTRVLGAASIMHEPNGFDMAKIASCPQVSPTTPIDDLVPLAAETELPVAVVDNEGRLLGLVDRSALLASLAESQRAQAQEPSPTTI